MNLARYFSPFRIIINHPSSELIVRAGFFNIKGTKVTNGEYKDPIKEIKNKYFKEQTEQCHSLKVTQIGEAQSVIESDGAVPANYTLFIKDFSNSREIVNTQIYEPRTMHWKKMMSGVTLEEFRNDVRNWSNKNYIYKTTTDSSLLGFLTGIFWQPNDIGLALGNHNMFIKNILRNSDKYETVSIQRVHMSEGGLRIVPKFDNSIFYSDDEKDYDHIMRNGSNIMNISYSNLESWHHEYVATIKIIEKEGIKIVFGDNTNENPLNVITHTHHMIQLQKKIDMLHKKLSTNTQLTY